MSSLTRLRKDKAPIPHNQDDLQTYLSKSIHSVDKQDDSLTKRHIEDKINAGRQRQGLSALPPESKDIYSAGAADNYVIADSKYRDRSYRLAVRLLFNLVQRNQVLQSGYIGITYEMVNLNEMSIYGPFLFPKIGTDPLVAGSASAYYFDEIVLDIVEFNGQSVTNPINLKSHFTFSITDMTDGRLSLMPKYNNYTFGRLQDNTPSSLTFRFYTPQEAAAFDDDFFEVYIDYGTVPFTLGIIQQQNGTGNNPNFTIGTDVISFENFYDSSILVNIYDSDNPKSIVYHSVYYDITYYTGVPNTGPFPTLYSMTLAGPLGTSPYTDITTDINRPGDLSLGPPQPNPVCNISIVAGVSPILFTSQYPNGLKTADIVVVTALTPNDPNLMYPIPAEPTSAPFLTQLFQPQGWPIVVFDSTQFSIEILDMSPLAQVIFTFPGSAPVTATFGAWPSIDLNRLQTVRIYDGCRRMRIPMRFRGVVRTYINYLIPTSS